MDESIYLDFAILEMIKFLMFESYYDKSQPFYGEKNIQSHYMDRVFKDTPIKFKLIENTEVLCVDEIIIEKNWYQDEKVIVQCGYKEFGDCKE